jgi:anaerobic selenocysteine-containing dehydrogenase
MRRLAREFAAARTGVAYSRLGVCNSRFGTLASFAVDVLDIVTGRLGAVGGAMFPSPAVDLPLLARLTSSDGHARWHSRVRGLPETAGDVPTATLAEEMETPGEGQVRAFVSFAGNPVLSSPDGPRLARALSNLEFMVSIDYYVNETTRFADVILPPAGPLSDDHVDLFFAAFAARDGIRWTPPPVARGENERADWEILLELAFRLGGGPTGIAPLDALYRIGRRLGLPVSPDDTVELALRAGPYGDHFLPWRKGISGKQIRDSIHGVDLGPLKPGTERRVYHRDRLIDLAPPVLMAALAEFEKDVARGRAPDEMVLIGRRDIRSNNSWMHNLPRLVSGKDRCVLLVNPVDAARLGLVDGGAAILETKVHRGEVPVRWSEDVRPGVVSLPHGHGHAAAARYQRVAGENPGVSANDWTSADDVESVVGQSILNGVTVRVHPVAGATALAAE